MACWIRRFRVPSFQRCYSAYAQPLTEPVETSTPPQTAKIVPPGEVQVSKVNGYTVASLENHGPVSSVSVYVKAGSRFESYEQQGLTHLLRNCAFFGNDEFSTFGFSRSIDHIGGYYKATATREDFIYSARFLRPCLEPVMTDLGSAVTRPKFKLWEVKDILYMLPLERAQAETVPCDVVLEALHKMAYRNQLCNPLYCPSHHDIKLTNEDLQSYVGKHFTPASTVVVGVGMSHEELKNSVEKNFNSEVGPLASDTFTKADYSGGEMHLPSSSAFAHSAVVCKGASRTGSQVDLLAAGVLQHILGAEPTGYVKWGSNCSASRLGKAGAMITDVPFSATSINLNYTDSGLFGLYLTSAPEDAGKLLKALMREVNEVAKGNVSEEDITRGKNQLKARYLMNTECQDALIEDIASQVSLTGSYSPIASALSSVDSITKDDVVKFTHAVFAGKASYVCHGNISSVPRLDQLLAEVFSRS